MARRVVRRGALDKAYDTLLAELPVEARPAMRAWVEARSAEWAARCELENAMIRSAGGYDW